MLTYADKRLLASEFPTKFLPNHHPLSELFKPLIASPLRNYETIRSILSCLMLDERVLTYNGFYYTELEYIMAKTGIWEFANVNLTSDDDKEIDKYIKSRDDDYLGTIIELLSTGYKISFAWIDKQNSFVVTVSGTERSVINKGVSMTAWSDVLPDAIMVLGYKVFIKTKGTAWLDYEQTGGRR